MELCYPTFSSFLRRSRDVRSDLPENENPCQHDPNSDSERDRQLTDGTSSAYWQSVARCC
jgi:hypothetical protein